MEKLQRAALNFSDSPEYFKASREEQRTAKENGFNVAIASQDKYKNATPEVQEQMFTEYNRLIDHKALNSQHNPNIAAREQNAKEIADNSFIGNTARLGKESIQRSIAGMNIMDDAVPGATPDADFGYDMSMIHKKNLQKQLTAPQKELAKDMETFNKIRENGDGFFNEAKAWGGLAVDIITNPKGVIQTGAESFSSLAASYAGGTSAGALATATGIGAPLAPLATVAGATAGATAEAIPHQFYQELESAITSEGLDFTEFNINKWAEDNPDKLKKIQTDSLKYATTIGFVDAITGKIVSKVAGLPARAAKEAARKAMKPVEKAALEGLAKKMGTSADVLLDKAIESKAADILATRSFKSKMANKAGQYVGEVVSEPISEAAGTAAIGQENTAENLIMETIGGIGAGPLGVASNVSLYGTKLANDKVAKTAKNILIPKTEAEKSRFQKIKEQKAATKAQRTSDRKAGYKKEVAETSPDADLSAYSSPDSKTYDPVKAMDILAKSDDPARYDDAMALRAQTKDALFKTYDRLDVLKEKFDKDPESLSNAENNEIEKLTELAEEQLALATKVKEKSDAMHNKQELAAANVEASAITDPETATDEEVVDNITKTFGSKGHKAALTPDAQEKILKNENISETTKAGVRTMQEANIAVEKMATAKDRASNKTMGEVAEDIENGSDGFKGINNYKRSIAYAMGEGNTDRANSEIASLENFAAEHRKKADVFQAVFNSERLGKELSPENAAAYAQMQKENSKLNIHKGSKELVNIVNMEADALEKIVASAKAYVAMGGVKGVTKEAASQAVEGPKKENVTPTINSATKSKESPSTSSVTASGKNEVVNPERIAKGLVAAIQTAQNSGKTEWLQKQIDSGYLNKAQTDAAKAVIQEVENKNAAKKKSSTIPSEKLIELVGKSTNQKNLTDMLASKKEQVRKPGTTKKQKTSLQKEISAIEARLGELTKTKEPETPKSDLGSMWIMLDTPTMKKVFKMVGNKKGAVEQAIKKHEQGKKLGKRQQQVIDALIAAENDYNAMKAKSSSEETSPSGDVSEPTSAIATENLQTVEAPTKEELLADDFGMTAETYGSFEVEIINASGETEYVSYNEAMQDLKNEKEMYEELRKCLTS